MRWLILVTVLAAPASLPARQADGQQCRRDGLHQAQKFTPPVARRLGDLPPGNLELAVQREVDGCHVPVIVRYGVDVTAIPRPRR